MELWLLGRADLEKEGIDKIWNDKYSLAEAAKPWYEDLYNEIFNGDYELLIACDKERKANPELYGFCAYSFDNDDPEDLKVTIHCLLSSNDDAERILYEAVSYGKSACQGKTFSSNKKQQEVYKNLGMHMKRALLHDRYKNDATEYWN